MIIFHELTSQKQQKNTEKKVLLYSHYIISTISFKFKLYYIIGKLLHFWIRYVLNGQNDQFNGI